MRIDKRRMNRIATALAVLAAGLLMLAGAGSSPGSANAAVKGNGQASASDHPVVQLRSIEGERAIFLPAINWSAGSFTSAAVPSLPLGWTPLRMRGGRLLGGGAGSMRGSGLALTRERVVLKFT